MKFVRVIKSEENPKKILEYQKKFLSWLKTYYKILSELHSFCDKCDYTFDSETVYGGFNDTFYDLVSKVTEKSESKVTADDFCFMPRISFDEADIYCKQFIQKAESILNKPNPKDSQKTDNLQNDFNTFQQQLMEKLKEGEKKGIVDWLDGVYLRNGKVEIIYSTARRFRHPDEYFDMRYDTPEELQQYNRWEYEFDNILRDFKKKHDIEIDIHA